MNIQQAQTNQMTERFWIVGGEYVDTRFEQLIEQTRQVLGPFSCYQQARKTWRELAEATRSNCTARFSIAREPLAAVSQ
tara:strand:+ start:9803 stop:10039 length:237 start_codon:yes stop_codon:yes gene_type:complete